MQCLHQRVQQVTLCRSVHCLWCRSILRTPCGWQTVNRHESCVNTLSVIYSVAFGRCVLSRPGQGGRVYWSPTRHDCGAHFALEGHRRTRWHHVVFTAVAHVSGKRGAIPRRGTVHAAPSLQVPRGRCEAAIRGRRPLDIQLCQHFVHFCRSLDWSQGGVGQNNCTQQGDAHCSTL